MKTFYRWTDAVRHLDEKLSRLKPIPGKGVAIEHGSEGSRVSLLATATASTAAAYAGPFKVIVEKNDSNTILFKLVNGAIPDSNRCGFFYHGDQIIPIPVPEPIQYNGDIAPYWLALEIRYVNNAFTFRFFNSGSMPPETPANTGVGMFPVHLARVGVTNGKGWVNQLHYGNIFSPGGLA